MFPFFFSMRNNKFIKLMPSTWTYAHLYLPRINIAQVPLKMKMACKRFLVLFCATLGLLLLPQNRVYMQVANISCLVGDQSFNNSDLGTLVHYSDIVGLGRISFIAEGEFGTFTANISTNFIFKADKFTLARNQGQLKIVDFTIPEDDDGYLVYFFLVRHLSLQLSLLCMSNYDEGAISTIRMVGRSKLYFNV